MEPAYLDNAATTRPYDRVIDKMVEVMKNTYANPSSPHLMGRAAQELLNEARLKVARSAGCPPANLYFTSGGTEGDNLAILGACALKKRFGRHIVTSKGEHDAVLNAMRHLERDSQYEADYISLDKSGAPRLDELEEKLRPDTVLVSMMLVNNELGSIYPILDIKEMVRKKAPNALLHCDAVQGYMKVPLDVLALGADLVTLSAHKIHGPKGVGALYVADGVRLPPLLHGGGHEGGLRPGTENVQSAAGFGEAAEIASSSFDERINALNRLKAYTLRAIADKVPQAVINSPDTGAPNIISLSLPGLPSEVIVRFLEGLGVFVSAGSACSSKKKGGSRVLRAAGLPDNITASAIRVSLGDFNNSDHCSRLAEGLALCTEQLMVT